MSVFRDSSFGRSSSSIFDSGFWHSSREEFSALFLDDPKQFRNNVECQLHFYIYIYRYIYIYGIDDILGVLGFSIVSILTALITEQCTASIFLCDGQIKLEKVPGEGMVALSTG
jgi:hypothetical protein